MIFDWNDEVTLPPINTVLDWGVVGFDIGELAQLTLHAALTSTMYHAEGTTGESTPITLVNNLVDHSSNRIVDHAGNPIVVHEGGAAILLHAKVTDTLFHAEA